VFGYETVRLSSVILQPGGGRRLLPQLRSVRLFLLPGFVKINGIGKGHAWGLKWRIVVAAGLAS
jgi:hypothetical protein